MKKIILEFFRRGLIACGFGPLVLAIFYLILDKQGVIETLTLKEVSLGIISLAILAFIAGGMNIVYQIERLPLMAAIFIHGTVLYISYLGAYLVNGWLKWGTTHILIFSGIFIICYLLIWIFIYFMTKRKTKKLNLMLQEKQQHTCKKGRL